MSDVPSQPLDEASAVAMARRERAQRLGCDGASEETLVNPNGTVTLRILDSGTESCRIDIGRFTREVVEY